MSQEEQQPIDREVLLSIANNLLRDHADYLPGVHADMVEQHGDILVFRGDFMLDGEGLPTVRSTVVFNLFKYLALTLSPQYRLKLPGEG